MTKYGKLLISSFLIGLLFLSSILPVIGSELDDIYEEQKKIEQKIQETEKNIKKTEQQRKNILAELQAINASIEKTYQEIEELENKLTVAQNYIDKTQMEIDVKENEVAERTKVFENRLRQIYKQGEVNILEVLFQATSISDFLTRFEFLKRIAENDTQLLAVLESEREALENKKKDLENQKANLLALKSSKETKNQQLQIASSRQKNLAKELEQQKEAYEKMLEDFKEQSEIIAATIRRMQSTGGQSPSWVQWPTPGQYRVTSPYGSRIHPITKKQSFHTGVDIAAPYGSNIVAAANGKVLFAGWQGAYGNTIIIDHGGGFATMYAHQSQFLVKAGDTVKMNQPIGKIGTSGWSTGPHLHFEVRINGDHVNPTKYLRK
ncbi:MAG: peptidoglycan DD-metalloendopeptidase family protein [Clostridia bacterium]|nr:peptidoglycan DD-metalloendopeptidase family protein [Clostridia bacterium]